jgi:hypothetical protein
MAENEKGMSPDGRCEAVLVTEPAPVLVCSWCQGELTDDDADCPSCSTPIDWGSSFKVLKEWQTALGAAT